MRIRRLTVGSAREDNKKGEQMANIKEGGSRGKANGKFTWVKAMGYSQTTTD